MKFASQVTSFQKFHIILRVYEKNSDRFWLYICVYLTYIYTVEYVFNGRIWARLSDRPYDTQTVSNSIPASGIQIVTEPVQVVSDRIKAGRPCVIVIDEMVNVYTRPVFLLNNTSLNNQCMYLTISDDGLDRQAIGGDTSSAWAKRTGYSNGPILLSYKLTNYNVAGMHKRGALLN